VFEEIFVVDIIDLNYRVCIAFEELLIKRKSQDGEHVRNTTLLQRFSAAECEEARTQALESATPHPACNRGCCRRTNPPMYNFNSPGTLSRRAMAR
jgi:hypothetical protein